MNHYSDFSDLWTHEKNKLAVRGFARFPTLLGDFARSGTPAASPRGLPALTHAGASQSMLWLASLVGVLRDRQMDRRPQLRSIPQGILKDS